MIIRVIVALLLLGAIAAEKDYSDVVQLLKRKIEDKSGEFWHSAYDRLAYLSDTYGPRMWGSDTLEMAIGELATMAYNAHF